MSTYQHRISFKGSEDSIDHFTKLLRDAKDIFGANSAEILLTAVSHWLKRPLASYIPRCNAQTRAGCSRIFYLQVLTTAFTVSRLNTELEKLKRDPTLKMMLEPHRIGRQEFLLEGLIIVLEFYRVEAKSTTDLLEVQPMDIESDKPTSIVPHVLGHATNSSSFLEHKRPEIGKPQTTWRQKIIDHQIAENLRTHGNVARYTGASKSSHQLILNTSDYDSQVVINKISRPEVTHSTRCTSVEYQDRARSRSIEMEPENRHLASWRQRLREQQLAENRKLTESIRSRSRMNSEERENSRQSPSPIRIQNSIQGPIQNGHNNCILSCKHTEQLDNKNYIWRPVHESAIEAAKKGSLSNFNSNYESQNPKKPPLPPTNPRILSTYPTTTTTPPPTPKLDRNNNNYNVQENDNNWLSSTPTHCRSRFLREASDPTSISTRRNVEPEPEITAPALLHTSKIRSTLRQKHDGTIGESFTGQILTLRERNSRCDFLSQYLNISPPDIRPVPGFEHPLSNFQRIQESVDCDEVFPSIILGNGATLKRKDYLRKIGITHILNAAEHRGVNIDKQYFDGAFHYMGLRIEDTPQTQICRHFLEVAEFLDRALLNGGKAYVNCVFGVSRSTTCIVAYLMLALDWEPLRALEHIRRKRPVRLNFGFLQQIADLEQQIEWNRTNNNRNRTNSLRIDNQ